MSAPIGNTNAAKAKRWEAAILRAVEAWPEKPDSTDCNKLMVGLNEAAHLFVQSMMLSGNIAFFKEFGDRLDGKSAQSMVLGSDPDNPLFGEIRRTWTPPPTE